MEDITTNGMIVLLLYTSSIYVRYIVQGWLALSCLVMTYNKQSSIHEKL